MKKKPFCKLKLAFRLDGIGSVYIDGESHFYGSELDLVNALAGVFYALNIPADQHGRDLVDVALNKHFRLMEKQNAEGVTE